MIIIKNITTFKVIVVNSQIVIPHEIRENGTVLINEFIRLGYRETDLVRLNRIRKHFKVI